LLRRCAVLQDAAGMRDRNVTGVQTCALPILEESPESQRWGTAMMSGGGPWEAAAPSYYFVTPPDPAWSPQETEEWLEIFSHTTLPAVSVHEVAPGHFSHWRHMRTLKSPVRRALHSMTLAERWA